MSRSGGLALDESDLGVARPASRCGFRPFDAGLPLSHSVSGLKLRITRHSSEPH